MSTTKHILIVEDEALIALDMESTLGELGHEVTTVSTLAEADAAVSRGNISLAILDYRLKEGTTDELATRLRDRGLPFIVCSGTAAMDELSEVFRASTFLSKPFTADALIDAVEASSGRLS